MEKIHDHRVSKCHTKLANELGFRRGILVLEIGSGVGETALFCASSGAYCVASELSFNQCRIIKNRMKQAKLWNISTIIRADGEHLPFKEN